MSRQHRFPAWMGHRAFQGLCALIVLAGAVNLWVRIRDGAGWLAILGAAGLLLLFVVNFANTVLARRQNQPGPR